MKHTKWDTDLALDAVMTDKPVNKKLDDLAPQLLAMLILLSRSCDGNALGTCKAPKWYILCEAATLINTAKQAI